MTRKRRKEAWWTVILGPLFIGVSTGFVLLQSVLNEAIWRGPGLIPVIRRADQPVDYYTAVSFLAFVSAVGFGGTIWLFIAVRRIRREVDK